MHLNINELRKTCSHRPLLLLLAGLMVLAGCGKDIPSSEDPERFTYLTEEYPPFNYSENGQLYGVSVDVLEGLFKNLGLSIGRQAIKATDWAAAYDSTLNNPGTMLFSMVKTVARSGQFKWVGPIAPHIDVAISMKSPGYSINQITDLNNYFTGVIDSYSSITNLMDQGIYRANIIVYKDLADLYQALAVNREVQFISYSETGHNLVIQALGYRKEDFSTPFRIHSDELFYAFNIETDDKIIKDFQDQLDRPKLEKSGDGSSVYEKILNRYKIIQYTDDGITEEMVVNLVNRTGDDLAADAAGTISRMNQGLAPYKDPSNPALYSFAYNTDVVMVAHATNPSMVGFSYAGKPDVAGKMFRDEIIKGALDHGTGWVDYTYTKPDQSGLFYKTTYYKLVTGSDSRKYIVCAGKFK